jgi:hypothetical protein
MLGQSVFGNSLSIFSTLFQRVHLFPDIKRTIKSCVLTVLKDFKQSSKSLFKNEWTGEKNHPKLVTFYLSSIVSKNSKRGDFIAY